jgi:prephenate dehydrogenase
MSVQITIIGLGQIGASIGLALAEHKELLERMGHDKDPNASRQAMKIGAVDHTSINLPSSVRNADIVLIALPIDQVRETISVISQDLKPDVVILDTSPVKAVVAAWAREMLPANCHYVGLTPVINPSYLLLPDAGIAAARADLFKQGMMGIIAPPRTPSEAIKLAADLTRMLGASVLFADPVEIDSLMAATHTLPQLISAALLNATVDQPGWREGRKVAGKAYAEVTSPSVQFSEAEALTDSALLNKENVLRVLASMIATLENIQADIHNEDRQALKSRLERAQKGRLEWWSQRQKADWNEDVAQTPEISMGSEIFGRLFGIRGKKKKI